MNAVNNSAVNAAAQVIISVMPIVGIVIGGTCLFFFLLWHHREIKLQIKTGLYTPKKVDYKAVALLLGLLLTGIGAIMTAVFALMEGVSYFLLAGLLPFVTGVCILIFYKAYPPFSNNDDGKKDNTKEMSH